MLDLNSGEWTDCGSYVYVVVQNVPYDAWRTYTMDDLNEAGYQAGDSYGNGMSEAQDYIYYTEDEKNYTIRVAYNESTQMMAVVSGEVPNRYYCWKMIGMTEEEIGGAFFEGELDDYIPYENSSDIDLHFSDAVSGGWFCTMQVCEVDEARLNSFIAAMTAAGYAETVREPESGMTYYEAAKCVDEELQIYLSIQLLWDGEKMAMCFLPQKSLKEREYLINHMSKYPCTANGRDPDAGKPELNTKIDLSAAVVEQLGNATAYLLDNMSMDALFDYIKELQQAGYQDADSSYSPDIPTNLGPDEPNWWLHKEGMGDQSYITVAGSGKNQKIVVLMSAEPIKIHEHELFEQVGLIVRPGIGYLETVVTEYYKTYGCTGYGQGWSSSGYISFYGSGYDMKDLLWNEQNLLRAGFTKHGEFNENGLDQYVYVSTHTFKYTSCKIYARLVLDGNFLEIEFGYGFRGTTHKDS